MVEFLIGLFVILLIVGVIYERDELELKNKKLEQETEHERKSIKLERKALELEKQRIKQFEESLKLEKKQLNDKTSNDNKSHAHIKYLTFDQIVKFVTMIAILAICIVLFFRMIYSI